MKKLKPTPSIVAVTRPFTFDKYFTNREKTLSEVRDGLRLKHALQRAVSRDAAPQSLIDAIRNGIRA